LLPNGTAKELDPEFPVARVPPVMLVTAEVATGFTVFQVKFILQLFCPAEIMQEKVAGVRVPDIGETTVAPTTVVVEQARFPVSVTQSGFTARMQY
jgi:hypothetical protein